MKLEKRDSDNDHNVLIFQLTESGDDSFNGSYLVEYLDFFQNFPFIPCPEKKNLSNFNTFANEIQERNVQCIYIRINFLINFIYDSVKRDHSLTEIEAMIDFRQHINTIMNTEFILPTHYDFSSCIHSFINRLWTQQWETLRPKANKLADIKSSPLPWVTANQPSRRVEVVLCRLRIRHTRLTHTHLISDLFPLSCHFWKSNISISVDHLFTCLALSSCRDSHVVPHDPKLALRNNHEAISRTLSYLRHIGILHLI